MAAARSVSAAMAETSREVSHRTAFDTANRGLNLLGPPAQAPESVRHPVRAAAAGNPL